jgi:Na+-driven multidrug efflux pump
MRVDVLQIAWALCAMAALWFLGTGIIRLIAYRSGTDATHGMHNVARSIFTVGLVAAGLFVVLTIVLLTQAP